MKTINIIGAGITGSFLSFFLKNDFNVKLFESSNLGGLSKTQTNIEGLSYQQGAHILSTNEQWILNIIKKSGLDLERIFYNVGINPLIDFNVYKWPLNIDEINKLPWYWKETILEELNKTSGQFGKTLEQLIINHYGDAIHKLFYKNYIKKVFGLNSNKIHKYDWFKNELKNIYVNNTYYNKDCYFPVNQGWNKLFRYLTNDVDFINKEVYYEDFNKNDIIILTGRPDIFFNKTISLEYVGYQFDVDSIESSYEYDLVFYPNFTPFISITQYNKLFNGKNIITKENTFINKGHPVVPMFNDENIVKYNNLINDKHIYLCGGLAEFKQLNMEESIKSAYNISSKIKHEVL